MLIRENMTCSALDGAAWNAVKSEQSGSEITYYFPVKAVRKTIIGGDLRYLVRGSTKIKSIMHSL